MKKILTIISCIAIIGCKQNDNTAIELNNHNPDKEMTTSPTASKKVVYQVFTRLFGNTNTTNKPWGTIEENGVGKFADFTPKALKEIKDLGVTHIWYTGVPHHDVITDYTQYGISNDDPDVVKGRAGSPYAVKDYYNVNPDLAVNVDNRLAEFEDLIKRSHDAGLKVIIDIVPNHVARNYQSLSNPEGISDFGAQDDTSVVYAKDNNFYYTPGEAFVVPEWKNGYQVLGGEKNPLADGKFDENPAKWTGNGSRAVQPDMNDWYETVKVNYGVRPDGTYDFDRLSDDLADAEYVAHYEFWKGKEVPNSWTKFKDIALYWTRKGVDGFRYDMAEMVPVEFWSYMNSHIKMENPDAFLLAEVYNPALYRDYIKKGKMDYLYDKVQLYDTIRNVMHRNGKTDHIPAIQEELSDIEHHMLHFLENHDEQRIASDEFAGNANAGKPAMVVSATISTSPTMIYFGQELGEDGSEDLGFGDPTRTSIFDYGSVPSYVRWVNDKKFDGGQSTKEELELRDFYKRLLNLTIESPAMMGDYADLHAYNRENTDGYTDKVLSFARWNEDQKLIVVSNFDGDNSYSFDLKLTDELIREFELRDTDHSFKDLLNGNNTMIYASREGGYKLNITLAPNESYVLELQKSVSLIDTDE